MPRCKTPKAVCLHRRDPHGLSALGRNRLNMTMQRPSILCLSQNSGSGLSYMDLGGRRGLSSADRTVSTMLAVVITDNGVAGTIAPRDIVKDYLDKIF